MGWTICQWMLTYLRFSIKNKMWELSPYHIILFIVEKVSLYAFYFSHFCPYWSHNPPYCLLSNMWAHVGLQLTMPSSIHGLGLFGNFYPSWLHVGVGHTCFRHMHFFSLLWLCYMLLGLREWSIHLVFYIACFGLVRFHNRPIS